MSTASKQPMTPKSIAASLVGGVFGVYSGMNVLIPAIGGGFVWYVGTKVLRPTNPAYLGAISTLVGHALWLLFGMVLLGQWGLNVIDLVAFGLGALWLWSRPGLAPVVVLSIFEVLALLSNVSTIWPEQFGSATHKALAVHIGLRVAVLYLMWAAFLRSRSAAPSDA